MVMTPILAPGKRAANDSWDYAEFVVKKHRADLVDHFNQIAGRPSYAMKVLQDEFIEDRMDPREMIAFIKVCRGLIAAAITTVRPPE
jgi:hypothetical protein